MSTDLVDLMAARALRDDGMQKVEDAEIPWSENARDWLEYLAAKGELFTAEDVRKLAGSPRHPNVMGAVFRRAVADELIEVIDWEQSHRVAARGRRLPVYRGVAS